MTNKDELKEKVERQLRTGGKLGTLASIIRRVEIVANDRRSSAHELAKVIGADVVLTARLLHVVNSASIAMERRIETVDDAVVILGFNHVRSICSGLLAADAVTKNRTARTEISALWRHSLATGAGAEHLQEHFLKEHSETDVFTAGLLCNIGRIILWQWFPDETRQIAAFAEQNRTSLQNAESQILGVTHAEIGYWAAEFWSFSERLVQIIRHHHGPASSPATDVVNVAYVVAQAKRVGSPGERRIVPLLTGVLNRLKLGDFDLDQLLRGLDNVYRNLEPVLRLMRT